MNNGKTAPILLVFGNYSIYNKEGRTNRSGAPDDVRSNLQLACLLDQAEFLRQHQIAANLQLALHKCLLGVEFSS